MTSLSYNTWRNEQTREFLEKRVFAIRDAIDVVRADARSVLYDLE